MSGPCVPERRGLCWVLLGSSPAVSSSFCCHAQAIPRHRVPTASDQSGEPQPFISPLDMENQRECGLFRFWGALSRHRPDSATYHHSSARGVSLSPPNTGLVVMPASQGYCKN